jgi:hypothetical protein
VEKPWTINQFPAKELTLAERKSSGHRHMTARMNKSWRSLLL